MKRIVSIDLGASSGRIFVGRFDNIADSLLEVHRFQNSPVQIGRFLYWDIVSIFREIMIGLTAANRELGEIDAIGIDSWAIDYGLINSQGELIANPIHYRDPRTAQINSLIIDQFGSYNLYRRSGIALHPFNTIYQLIADRQREVTQGATKILLIPDLLNYFLTGQIACEATNFSTTQMMTATREIDFEILDQLEIKSSLLPDLVDPGHILGRVGTHLQKNYSLSGSLEVINVASHDTASAVAGIGDIGYDTAYISSGTWSLIGLRTKVPYISASAMEKGFTNELGAYGENRLLKNQTGFWLLQQLTNEWKQAGDSFFLDSLMAQARQLPTDQFTFDPDLPTLSAPGAMANRIVDACKQYGSDPPNSKAQFVQSIVESLAKGYRRAIWDLQDLTGVRINKILIIGGGAQNAFLREITTSLTGIEVIQGPVEAAISGNAKVILQALR